MREVNATRKCDACGKIATETDVSFDSVTRLYDGWWSISFDIEPTSTSSRQEIDACSVVCGKQIFAKLGEVKFNRDSAENEAKCLDWALEQAGIRKGELLAKTEENERFQRQIRTLEAENEAHRKSNTQALADENNRLTARVGELEHRLAESEKLTRSELAAILREAAQPRS